MDLYTLTSRFFPRFEITEFTSVIWTERYSSAGDVQLVVPATPDMAEILAPGTLLGLRGTKEVMLLDKHSVENDLLTVSGPSLPKFLDERPALFEDADYDGESGSPYGDYKATTTAGQLISSAVYRMVIDTSSTFNLDWAREKIVGLELGHVDANGTPKPLSFAKGTLYDGIQSLATEEGLGFKLYLESAKYSTKTYVLKFATYRGRNRTSDQDVHGVVRLSPRLDSLTDVKEIVSLSEYKNVIYVSYKNSITKHYVNPDLPIPTGFDRRSLFVEAPDLFFDSDQKIIDFREQVARNELANHIYVQMVDGQVSPQIDYKFGDDYYLGDVLELQGYSGLFSKARVTEYIRAQDQFGTKEYPTLAVLDPLKTGYLPDLEPDPPDTGDSDDPSNFDDDSNFDLDIEPGNDDDWNPTDENSGYDPEHDPNSRDRKLYDPNAEPEENFGEEGNGPGDGSGVTIGRKFIMTGYYPDQNNGEAIAYLEYGGVVGDSPPALKSAWKYKSEDLQGRASWLEVLPHGWTYDRKQVIVRSEEQKESTSAYPWSYGYAFWLKDPTQANAIKRTETIPENARYAGPEFGETHAYRRPNLDDFWSESATHSRLYAQSQYTYPLEYLYANGTITTDPAHSTDNGVMVDSGYPVELYGAWGSDGMIKNIDLQRILGRPDFPWNMHWSSFYGPWPSPDGSKLVFYRREISANATWQISSLGAIIGGSFTLTVGPVGNEIMSYETAPIGYNSTAESVWEALLACGPLLQDPRLNGYPYQPYYLGSTPLEQGGQLQLYFDHTPPNGVWITIDTSGLRSGILETTYSVYSNRITDNGPIHWYMCDYDGSNLEEMDLGGIDPKEFAIREWSPDSTKLLGDISTPTLSGRYLTYDVSTGEVDYPLDDYRADNPIEYFVTAPIMSPDSTKLAWVTSTNELWISNVDGSNATKLYEQTVAYNSTDRDSLVLGGDLAWSFDSKKLAVIDNRDESPVWVVTISTGAMTKIWPGSGWDNSNDQKWLYDMQQFEGG